MQSSVTPSPTTIDVRELIVGSGPFGPNEVRAIADSLGTTTDTHRELRLTVQELQQVGDLSPAASVRLGVGLYLLGRSSEAVVSLKSGDGSALALFALGLAQAALAATEDACASFDAARTAGYPAGACLAAKANTLRAAKCTRKFTQAGDIDGSDQVDAVITLNDVYNGNWPGDQYLNVFVCGAVGSGIAGYTHYPSNFFGNSIYFKKVNE